MDKNYSLEIRDLAKSVDATIVIPPNPFRKQTYSLLFAREITRLAKTTDIWSISTPVNLHYAYLGLTLNAGINKVFLEKPSTNSTIKTRKILEKYPNSLIQVDYGERAHPVVLAIIRAIKSSNFHPKHMFNWRARDTRTIPWQRINSGDETKITVADLIHDISEVDILIKTATGIGLDNGFSNLSDIELTSWYERYPNKEYENWVSDVGSDFTINFSNNIDARIRGDGDFDFRRYFILWNEEMAFFGQTLKRDQLGITPCAAQIIGPKNVSKFVQIVESGNMVVNTDFIKAFNETSAKILDISIYEPNPLKTMIENCVNAKTNSDLICSLSSALGIEVILEKVYRESGKEELYKTPVIVDEKSVLLK